MSKVAAKNYLVTPFCIPMTNDITFQQLRFSQVFWKHSVINQAFLRKYFGKFYHSFRSCLRFKIWICVQNIVPICGNKMNYLITEWEWFQWFVSTFNSKPYYLKSIQESLEEDQRYQSAIYSPLVENELDIYVAL